MSKFIGRHRMMDHVRPARFLAVIPSALACRGGVALRAFLGFTPSHAERRAMRWLSRTSSDAGGAE